MNLNEPTKRTSGEDGQGPECRAPDAQVGAMAVALERVSAQIAELSERLERVQERGAEPQRQTGPRPFGTTSGRLRHGPGSATYMGRGRILVMTAWGVKLFVSADDLSLTPQLIARKRYEDNFVHFLDRVLRPGDVAVDVGANVGLFTLTMAQLVGEEGVVHAYEPMPTNLKLLRDSVACNWLHRRISIVEAAVGASPGEAVMAVHERFLGLGQVGVPLISSVSKDAQEESQQITVPLVTLDAMHPSGNVDVLKIDVEGAELQVLRGASRLLEDRRIRYIVFELRDSLNSQDELADFQDFVCDLVATGAWRICDIDAEGVLRPLSLKTAFTHPNWQHLVLELT